MSASALGPHDDGDGGSGSSGVTLKKIREGYTWSVIVAADNSSLEALLRAADRAAEVDGACREIRKARCKVSRRKISTTVYLEPDQDRRLRRLHARTNVPIAWYIRRGIDLVLAAAKGKRVRP